MESYIGTDSEFAEEVFFPTLQSKPTLEQMMHNIEVIIDKYETEKGMSLQNRRPNVQIFVKVASGESITLDVSTDDDVEHVLRQAKQTHRCGQAVRVWSHFDGLQHPEVQHLGRSWLAGGRR